MLNKLCACKYKMHLTRATPRPHLRLQGRLAASGAAVAEWWDAPSDALPYVLHFEALDGLQKQGGGQLSPAELAQLSNRLGCLPPAAGASAVHDPMALLSEKVQNLTVQHSAVQVLLATQGVTLLQCSSALQQHGQALQRHEADIMAHGAAFMVQHELNNQTSQQLARLHSQLPGAGAWPAVPAGQQQPLSGSGRDGFADSLELDG